MQIKVRVRTNDVHPMRANAQMVHDGFILYDNCTEVKFGSPIYVNKDDFAFATFQRPHDDNKTKTWFHSETYERFEDILFMVRDICVTEARLEKNAVDLKLEKPIDTSNKFSEIYHYNTFEWKDRITKKRYRLVFDTVAFLTDDQGNTIRKIDG